MHTGAARLFLYLLIYFQMRLLRITGLQNEFLCLVIIENFHFNQNVSVDMKREKKLSKRFQMNPIKLKSQNKKSKWSLNKFQKLLTFCFLYILPYRQWMCIAWNLIKLHWNSIFLMRFSCLAFCVSYFYLKKHE